MIDYRALPIRLSGPVPRPPRALAQAAPSWSVVITDPNGLPFPGAEVSIEGGVPVRTDSRGVAVFPNPGSGSRTVRIRVEGFDLVREGRGYETLFVQVPICAPQVFLTPPEILAVAVGAAMVGAGLYWKLNPVQIVGEILFGAAAFTAVYRHSCRV
jgi:hypothetical protein